MEIINKPDSKRTKSIESHSCVCGLFNSSIRTMSNKKKTNFIDYFQLRTSNGTTLKNMFSFEKIFH